MLFRKSVGHRSSRAHGRTGRGWSWQNESLRGCKNPTHAKTINHDTSRQHYNEPPPEVKERTRPDQSRVMKRVRWTRIWHNDGTNTHNVSATERITRTRTRARPLTLAHSFSHSHTLTESSHKMACPTTLAEHRTTSQITINTATQATQRTCKCEAREKNDSTQSQTMTTTHARGERTTQSTW